MGVKHHSVDRGRGNINLFSGRSTLHQPCVKITLDQDHAASGQDQLCIKTTTGSDNSVSNPILRYHYPSWIRHESRSIVYQHFV